MKHTLRKFLALLLAVLTLGSLPVLAEADTYKYRADQYYQADTSLTRGFTVQVSASKDIGGAEKTRNKMLNKGYDSFVYYVDGQYRVMCGKFRTQEAALHYSDHIHNNTDRDSAYITNIYLPDWAYEEFEEIYSTDPFNTQGDGFSAWENPTGPFYNGDYAGSTKRVYTVQFSAGTNFKNAERHRDEMTALGFDSFVYKKDGKYRTMSGMFSSYEQAEIRCEAIKTYTDESDAYVTTVDIPTSYVNYQVGRSQEDYYSIYANLLYNYNWARNYLPADEAAFLIDNGYLEYVYYVCDIDGNGVDELIIVHSVVIYEGTWAVFSCDRNGAYLVTSGATFSIPLVSVCQEKGIMAMQGYYKGVGSCELTYIKNGKRTGSKNATVVADDYIEVLPTAADRDADGYYMALQGYEVNDLSRLTGRKPSNGSTPTQPVQPASGYTRAGVLAAARDAAANSRHYSTVSDKNVELVVPSDSQFLKNPFPMKVNAEKNGKAIYIMPKPEPGNGNLGKVTHGEKVMILSENDYYYFFVTEDGRAGWNGKSYFSEP